MRQAGLRVAGCVLLTLISLCRTTSAQEAPRSVSNDLQNQLAFSRMLGFVRYFHPSDEAVGADWWSLAVEGMRAVEDAATPEALADSLNRIFRPIAPTVSAFPTVGDMQHLPRSEPPADATRARVAVWRRVGLHAPSLTPERLWLGPPFDPDELAQRHLPDPLDPWLIDLTRGISCIVPLALYGDDQGTLPRAAPQRDGDQRAAPERDGDQRAAPRYSGNDRATRLAAVALAWNAVQHFHPCLPAEQHIWPSALARALMEAAAVPDERVFLVTLQRMMAETGDGQAGAEWAQAEGTEGTDGTEETEGTDGTTPGSVTPRPGRLPVLWEWIDGALMITHVAPEIDGLLRRGDIITTVNRLHTGEAMEVAEKVVAGATPAVRRCRALDALRLGPAGDSLQVGVQRAGGTDEALRVPRSPAGDLREPRPAQLAEVAPGIRYCDLIGVDADSFAALSQGLAHARGVIFDLRRGPDSPIDGAGALAALAHLVAEPLELPAWELPVVSRPDRRAISFEPCPWRVEPAEPRITGRVVFIAHTRTQGGAEAALSVAAHHGLADIVGEPTAGAVGTVAEVPLPGGYLVRFTQSRVPAPDGTLFRGVSPTIPARRTSNGIAAGRDELLDRAVEILREQ